MSDTHRYYEQFALDFFESTVKVDMASLHQRFLAGLAEGAHLLDAGCGSGRDAKAFADAGFKVSAFDASPELAALATQHCGFEVAVRRFEDVTELARYDGVWCCASLLHVAQAAMPQVLLSLWSALRPGGRIYVSFKLGEGERDHQGRRFTDANEPMIRQWFGALSDLNLLTIWRTADQRPDRQETWVNALATKLARPVIEVAPESSEVSSDLGTKSPEAATALPAQDVRGTYTVKRLVTGGEDHFLPHLSAAFAGANEVDFAVAFVRITGLRLLMADLEALVRSDPPRRLRFLTSDYLDVTDPVALRLLLVLSEQGADVRVFTTGQTGSFHLKAYLFAQVEQAVVRKGTAFIGSSNISRSALQSGLEWNYRVIYPGDPGFLETRQQFETLFDHPQSQPLTSAWIDAYEARRLPPPRAVAPGSHEADPPPVPTKVQSEALMALSDSRERGYRRGLVVLATGLGKTWLAAFDAVSLGARKVLFVAHRDEILTQAANTFLRIWPKCRIGYYTGKARDADADVLCASIQTIGKTAHLNGFDTKHFDYIVVDEFHHAAASTYRRLLDHFTPHFLLGLTATPDRTDQSDILSLCDDNLVHTCNLFDGIHAGLLAPFHYFGIRDETVDYTEIPWRSGKFDPEQLTNKLATIARFRHVLREWRGRKQQRTLAFCVSTRHADYMAEQFQREGIAAASVHSESKLGRAQALEQLESGEIQVLFSVDLFNEGVDVPSIDTVMMLRPTESKILFLQQLGRGLRRCEGKSHLVVLDFIGNHQAFLQRPQALFGVELNHAAMAAFARDVENKSLSLPPGCFVNYDLAIIDFLKALDSDGPRSDFLALKEVLGRRPTLTEFYRSGSNIGAMRKQHGSWVEMLLALEALTPIEASVAARHLPLLREVEVTSMTKSFKAVLLEAFVQLDGLREGIHLDQLCAQSRVLIDRRPGLRQDLASEVQAVLSDSIEWRHYWRRNPVAAWIGENRTSESPRFFTLENEQFQLSTSVAPDDVAALSDLLQELVEFRLAAYEVRLPEPAESNVVALPGAKSTVIELPYFPNLKIACGHFRLGRTDAEQLRTLPRRFGSLDPSRFFIAQAMGNSMDGGSEPIRDGDVLLMELLTSDQKVYTLDQQVVALERAQPSGDYEYLLRRVVFDLAGNVVLRANNSDYADMLQSPDISVVARLHALMDPLDLLVGQSFMREQVPALFGEEFNPGNWNVGHVVLNRPRRHILFVTLNKQGRASQHQYLDHWVDEHTLHWQSQNQTRDNSTRGVEIVEHEARNIPIHLFIRVNKAINGKGAPFVYRGRVRYLSHTGNAPMSVLFEV